MTSRCSLAFSSLLLSFVVVLGACSSNSNSTGGLGGTSGAVGGNGAHGGGTGALGGSTGSVAGHTGANGGSTSSVGGTSGGGGAIGTCAGVPTCLTNLIADCTPSGICMTQSSGSVLTGDVSDRTCYANGYKTVTSETIDVTTGTFSGVTTVSKSGRTCYTEEVSDSGAGGSGGSIVITLKNAAGTPVATLSDSTDGNSTIVKCGGATYTVSDSVDCGMPSMGAGGASGSDCTEGTCAP